MTRRKAKDDNEEFQKKLHELRALVVMQQQETGNRWLFSTEEPVRARPPLLKFYCPSSNVLDQREKKPRLCGRCQCFRDSVLECTCACSYSICSICEMVLAADRRRLMDQMMERFKKQRMEWVAHELKIIKQHRDCHSAFRELRDEELPEEMRYFVQNTPNIDLSKIDSFVF
jgi:hypothetical protein